MRFQGLALQMLARGVAVIPLKPNSKAPACPNGALDASRDPAQIARWDEQRPGSNCGAVGQPATVWILDSDDESALLEATGQTTLPETFTVMATRGPHLYFLQNAASRLMGNVVVPGIAEARQNNLYCVSPGSIHPSGKQYRIAKDIPIVEAPQWLTDWLLTKKSATAPTKGVPGIPNPSSVQSSLVWLNQAVKRWGVEVLAKPVPLPDGGYKIFVTCPRKSLHTEDSGPSESALFITPDGTYGYDCKHAHCQDLQWQGFRAAFEVITDEQLDAVGCVEQEIQLPGDSVDPPAEQAPTAPPRRVRKTSPRDFPLDCLYGPLGDLAKNLGVPVGIAYPMLLTAFSFRVPECCDLRANLFCVNLCKPGAAKGEGAKRAMLALRVPSIRITLASDRGVEKALGGGGRILFYFDEFITTLNKAMIQHSALPGTLCQLYSEDDVGTADKAGMEPIKARVSFIGNLAITSAAHFAAVLGSGVLGGLYDRLLIASTNPDEPRVDYLPPSHYGLDDLPDFPAVPVQIPIERFHEMNRWIHAREEEFPGLDCGRIGQNLMKIAMITCSANGETTMSVASFEHAAKLSLGQCHLRRYYQPSNAISVGAQVRVFVHSLMQELNGKWIPHVRLMHEILEAIGCSSRDVKTEIEAMIWTELLLYDKEKKWYGKPGKVIL